MIRVVHINFDYAVLGVGGASIAAGRIHRGLLDYGIDSQFLCTRKRAEGKAAYEVPRPVIRRLLFLQTARVLRNLPRLVGYRQSVPVNMLPSGMANEVNRLRPDVVHIHWVSSDTLSLREILRIKAPVIISLHDLWFILGTEHHPCRDRRHINGFTKSNSRWLDRWLWNRKRKLSESRKLCFVGPSEWAAGVAKDSIIGKRQFCQSIPNPVDVRAFHFDPVQTRKNEKYTILFGCYGGTRNPYKGFDDLRRSLECIPAAVASTMRMVVFGEEASPYSINGLEITFMGKITDQMTLIQAYHQADMLAFPSKEETQGQVKAEALACGLPVVAFDRTACAEGITHLQSGWVAEDGDITGFKEGILWCYEQWRSYSEWIDRRKRISRAACDFYSESAIIPQWIALYQNLKSSN